ncbi:carbon-nitrogen hydrolase family protein [Sphingomonas crocodyli]|uniref:Carbon-nitrogen hydrolase family protein n=1 Tax=Sphingomonas crocodyli TaxID=1979270 RepID=A0A437M7M6_9SPHN|nr:carbon-nitrogen hydrolase family protein [Sphingomonas crocodyli]RVT93535.1 carbon-nitrogen hydrolase family protein [Sphingomonas crocodyli]
MKLAVIQMNSVSDVSANIERATHIMRDAVEQEGADWLLLPEHYHWAGGTPADRLASAEYLGEGPAYRKAQDFAREHGVFVHAGSLYERISGSDKIYNTSVVFDRAGREIATYRKIHLFDIDTPNGGTYRESDTVASGDTIAVYEAEGVRFGCSICYDLRFPELFQALADQGADVIAMPAAFLFETGKAHWEPLLRARAIETQTYIAASGSWGEVLNDGKPHRTFGHSMIVDPWGQILSHLATDDGYLTADVDAEMLARVRQNVPLRRHRVLPALYR